MAYWYTTDWHGIKDFYPIVKGLVDPKDTIIFGGDANDRGPHGWELIKTLLRDDQFIYIRGNHEQMLIDAARDPSKEGLLFSNGGGNTFNDYLANEMNDNWIKHLDKMATLQFAYTNEKGQLIYITHSGYWGASTYDKLWDRYHCDTDWDNPGCDIIIHGHTPICYVAEYNRDQAALSKSKKIFNEPYWYCGGRKCCVDTAAFHTKQTILLNLDTWEHHLIKAEG